jgi:tetratricopeptide (TPR) repeat protein
VDHNSPTSQKLAAVFLFGLALITYLPSLGNGFIWDDDAYVQHNPTLRSASGLWQIWTEPTSTPQYYPLVYTTFWVEHHLWGDRPLGYHVDNMLLHAIGAVLLWRLLKRLKIPMPWLAAAIFAVHPINVESVAWITERKNVLSGVFYFLAFGAYLGAIESTTLNRRRYAVALVFFLLALFSKTVTATFLAAVLLVLWWRRGKITRKEIVPLLPFFIVGIALGSVTGYLERTHIGAHGVEWSSLTPLDRLLIATRAVWFYAGKLALPIKLTFIYPRWLIDPHDASQWMYPVALAAILIVLWRLRGRIGRGPLTAVLFFIGTLFPALGFVNVYPMRYSFVADHFQYLAGIGLISLFTALVALMRSTGLRMTIASLVVAVLAALSFRQEFIYKDGETLWRDTIAKNPNSWMAHANLGHVLHAQGRDEQGWQEDQLALALAPNLAEPHFTVAIGDAVHGDLDGAIHECRAAIAIDPDYAPAYANLAKALLSQNKVTEALDAANQAVKVAPDYALGHFELARALEQMGNLSQAAQEYQTAARLGMRQ